MRVFITGASGWIGSATTRELIMAGHEVAGLARSEESAAALEGWGAVAVRGGLDDLAVLREAAGRADGVIHLANKHDWGPESDRAERAAVEAIAEALTDTGRAFVVANGMSGIADDRMVLESDPSPEVGPDAPRGGSENLALDVVGHGVRTIITRFAPSVHGVGDRGFVAFLANIARERGVSAYIGDGSRAWSAVHRSDAARLIRLGLEAAPPGTRLHAVAEERVTTRSIAEALGAALGLPVVALDPAGAADHFGFMGRFFGMDMSASSERTRALLGWSPTGPTLVDDILAGAYGRR